MKRIKFLVIATTPTTVGCVIREEVSAATRQIAIAMVTQKLNTEGYTLKATKLTGRREACTA